MTKQGQIEKLKEAVFIAAVGIKNGKDITDIAGELYDSGLRYVDKNAVLSDEEILETKGYVIDSEKFIRLVTPAIQATIDKLIGE